MKDVVSDGLKVISEVKVEIRDLISEFNDVSKLEAKYASSRGDAAMRFLDSAETAFERLKDEHIASKQLVSAWRGDFQEELNVKGADKAPRISELLGEMTALELEVDNIVKELNTVFSDVLNRMNSKKVAELKEMQYKDLVEEARLLEKDLTSWISMDKKIKDQAEKCHNYVKVYDAALKRKLANYQGLALGHFLALLEGKNEYAGKPEEERRGILQRYWNQNGEEIKTMLAPDLLKRIQAFLTRSTLNAELDVEQKKTKNYMSYNESLVRLLKAGYKRHLRPSEFFSIVLDVAKNPKSTSKALADDMMSGYGEWLSMAFRLEGTKLIVALDPDNLSWDGNTYVVSGNDLECMNGQCVRKVFDIGDKKAGNYYSVSKFPNELIQLIYGVSAGELSKYNAEIYLPPREYEWWPVGQGGDNDRFNVSASNISWASRGVR